MGNDDKYSRLNVVALREFTTSVLNKFGVPVADARIAADVLVAADQRGINSHGLQRLGKYTERLKTGIAKPTTNIKTLKETPNTLLISGGDGLGQVVSYYTMKLVIDIVSNTGISRSRNLVSVPPNFGPHAFQRAGREKGNPRCLPLLNLVSRFKSVNLGHCVHEAAA